MKPTLIIVIIQLIVFTLNAQSLFIDSNNKDKTATDSVSTTTIKDTIQNGIRSQSKITVITETVPSDKRFYFFGTTAVSTTEELLTSFQGSQKFLFLAKLLLPKARETGESKFFAKPGIDFLGGVNVINLRPKSISKDSVDFISLMFPETGNFGLMLNPVFHWGRVNDVKGTHTLSTEFSYCLRQNRIDSVVVKDLDGTLLSGPENITFSVLNINFMPFRYSYTYIPSNEHSVTFSLGVYFNWFNIPNEDVSNFNKLYPINKPLFLKPEKSSIPSVGVKMACNINGFILYADLRQNRKTQNLEDNNPYKGFVFNVGFAQNIQIFGF